MTNQQTLLPTADDIAFYNDNGYWVSPPVVSPERLEELIRHQDLVYDDVFETGRVPLQGWKKGRDDDQQIRKVDNAWWADLTIRSLALDPLIGQMGAMLAGTPAIRLWHDQLLYKPGGGQQKGNVGWHQDYGYWQCTYPADMLTAWVALVRVDETNGCMQMIPGSHKWGLYEGGMDFFDQDREAQMGKIRTPEGQSVEPVSVVLEAGQVSFHHCLTLHGSGPNLTQAPRRSLVIHMLPEHIRYRAGSASDNHNNVARLGGSDGDLWRGEEFPQIYPPE